MRSACAHVLCSLRHCIPAHLHGGNRHGTASSTAECPGAQNMVSTVRLRPADQASHVTSLAALQAAGSG